MQSLYDYEHIAKSNLFKLNCKYIIFLLSYIYIILKRGGVIINVYVVVY